jgi:hypothetical protein
MADFPPKFGSRGGLRWSSAWPPGPIAGRLSFIFGEHKALSCRARKAIMHDALMAALNHLRAFVTYLV